MRALPFRLDRLFPTSEQLRQLPSTLLVTGAIILSHFLLSGHDHQRLLELVILLVVSAMLVLPFRIEQSPMPAAPLLRWSLIVMLLLGVVSSLFAFSPRHGLLEVLMFVLLLLTARAGAREMSGDYDHALTLVLRLLGLGSALYLMQIIPPGVAALVSAVPMDVNSLAPGFSNFRFFNHGQTIGLPLLVLLYCRAGRSHRPWWFALAAVWWMLAFALGARGTSLALAIGTVAALVWGRRHCLPYCKAMLATAAAGFASYKVCFTLLPALRGMDGLVAVNGALTRMVTATNHDRIELWQWSWELIRAHPWLGIGPMHFAHELARVAPVAHPHAWLPQLGAEWGIPAMLCAATAAACALHALLRTGRQLASNDAVNHTIFAAFVCTGVAILVDGLVSGLIVMPVSQLFIVLYLGLAGGWMASMDGALVLALSRRGQWAMTALVAVVALGLVCTVLPEWWSTTPYTATHPRFWLSGHF